MVSLFSTCSAHFISIAYLQSEHFIEKVLPFFLGLVLSLGSLDFLSKFTNLGSQIFFDTHDVYLLFGCPLFAVQGMNGMHECHWQQLLEGASRDRTFWRRKKIPHSVSLAAANDASKGAERKV